MATNQLSDAKTMLREAGKNDLASWLDTSVDYFISRARYELQYNNANGGQTK